MKTIDALGKPCPIPVVEAKKALSVNNTEEILINVDNIVAVQNLEKMASGFGYQFSYNTQSDKFFEVYISKNGKTSAPEAVLVSAPSQAPANLQLVVAISKNTMGEGSEELGKILIKGFIYSLTELETPPAFVIFFNSGVYLSARSSNTIEDLKKLEQRGTKILSCGTCLNYYKLQEELAVGEVTDMFGITEKISSAARLINI